MTQMHTNTHTETFWVEMFKRAIKTQPEIMQLLDAKREDEYWEAIKTQNLAILSCDEYLVKNAFKFNDSEQPELRTLFNYLKINSNFCVAGGYPTLQFLDKNLNDFPNSDIDVYVLNLHNINNAVKHFVDFLDVNFEISEIYSHTDMQAGVFSIKCNKLKRIIQIIGTHSKSPSEIFNSFDSSYCKCGLYLGETYVTFDALYAKKTNTALFYVTYPKETRAHKALGLGLKIFGYDIAKLCKDKIQANKNGDAKQEDTFKFRRTKEGMMRDFEPVKKWMNKYDNIMCNNVFNPLNYYDGTGLEKYISLVDYANIFNVSENRDKETFVILE